MRLPFFQGVKKHSLYKLRGFSGLDKRPSCKVQEFSEMMNLSSKAYPAMSPICPRVKHFEQVADIFLYNNEYFKITRSGEMYRGTKLIGTGLTTGLHEFSVLGDDLIIMPDKRYYNLNSGVFDTMQKEWSGQGVFCTGEVFGYRSEVNTIHVQVDIGSVFRVGDTVTLLTGSTQIGQFTIGGIKSDGYVLFENAAFTLSSEVKQFTLIRRIPDLKNTFECNNRLWGTCDNVIYASALGDPFNFYKYRGLSTDSYFKEIYSAGVFTAGASLGETPVFFKERAIYRVYGNTPESFHVDVKEAVGVSEDCRYSAVCLDGAVYYAGSDGIYAYSSAYPVKISDALGSIRVGRARGGSDGRRYYVSFSQFDGISEELGDIMQEYYDNRLYAYDSILGLWYCYDPGLKIKRIVSGHFGSVFKKINTMAVTESGEVFSVGDKPAGVLVEESERERIIKSESYGVTGILDFGPCAEINTVRFVLKLDEDAEFYADISFDGGEFERIGSVFGGEGREKKITFRVPKKRFSYCRLRMGGIGEYELSGVDIYYRSCYNEKR